MTRAERPTAIVTGAAAGIGRALCLALARQGVAVAVVDVNDQGATAVAARITAEGGRARAYTRDLVDAQALVSVAAELLQQYGGIDLLFNVAGLEINGDVLTVDAARWQAGLAVDLQGVLNATHAIYPILREQRRGQIITVSSLAGLVPLPGLAYYGAAKHAVVGFMLALRAEAQAYGVAVSLACPALVDTKIRANTAAYLGRQPQRQPRLRWPKPITAEACAHAILQGVARRQAVTVIPWTLTWVWWLYRLSPGLFTTLAGRLRTRWTTDPVP